MRKNPETTAPWGPGAPVRFREREAREGRERTNGECYPDNMCPEVEGSSLPPPLAHGGFQKTQNQRRGLRVRGGASRRRRASARPARPPARGVGVLLPEMASMSLTPRLIPKTLSHSLHDWPEASREPCARKGIDA